MRQTWNKSLYNTYTLYLNTVCLMHALKCCPALVGKHTHTHTQAHKASGTRRGCNLTPWSMQQKILNAFHALRLTLAISVVATVAAAAGSSALFSISLYLSHPLSVYPHTQRSAACLRVSSSDVTAAVAVSVDMGVALTATTPTNLLANLGITHTRTHTHRATL